MLTEDKENLLVSMFCQLDDFCLALESWKAARTDQFPVPTRRPRLSDSELLTLYTFYQYSGYKCFQYYYQNMVLTTLKSYFPAVPSYARFVRLIPYLTPGLFLFLKYQTGKSRRTGVYFIDSKKLPVCDNRRIHANKVFQGVARRGKSSTGWFYGFKVHLVINNQGEIMNFKLTSGNVADNNHSVLHELLDDLKG
ncbi:MAG: transposase, partial [Bacteroidota bacterium]